MMSSTIGVRYDVYLCLIRMSFGLVYLGMWYPNPTCRVQPLGVI